MDYKKGDMSHPQQNTSADVAHSRDHVYDTEETDDDDISKYEFAPRAVTTSRVSNRSHSWSEQETFVLLEAWGEKLLKHNRRNLRSDEWYEVADKVSEFSEFKRNKTHCRNRMDTLKRKYKKEKIMFAENKDYSSNWVFFSKMDMIVSSPSSLIQSNGNEMKQIVNFEVNPDHANSSDEMKDGLEGDSGFAKNNRDNLEDIPPKKERRGKKRGGGDPFKLIADCINKFSEVYENVEKSKSKQLLELEKMRIEFQRDVELEKGKILKKGLAEIAKIQGVDIEESNLSPAS